MAIQPDFAAAYAELAMVQVQFLFGGPYSPDQIMPKAEAAARKALQLDETQPRAHRTLSQVLSLYHWCWAEGDKELERATALGGLDQPSAISSSLIRRWTLPGSYRRGGARTQTRSPLGERTGDRRHGVSRRGRLRPRDQRIAPGAGDGPPNNWAQYHMGVTLLAMGRPADTIRELEPAARQSTGHNSRVEAYLGYAYAAAGRAEDPREVLKEFEAHRQDQYVSWFGIALIHEVLGEKAPALAAVQRAFEDHAVELGLGNETIATEHRARVCSP